MAKTVEMGIPEQDYPALAHLYRPFSCRRCRHTFLAPTVNSDPHWANKMIRRHEEACLKNLSRVTQFFLLDMMSTRMVYV